MIIMLPPLTVKDEVNVWAAEKVWVDTVKAAVDTMLAVGRTFITPLDKLICVAPIAPVAEL